MSAVVEDTAVVEKTLDIDDRYRNRVGYSAACIAMKHTAADHTNFIMISR